jgi:hypothetical protein
LAASVAQNEGARGREHAENSAGSIPRLSLESYGHATKSLAKK